MSYHDVSAEGRARCAETGRRNLVAFQKRQRRNALVVKRKVADWRAQVEREFGDSLNAWERALLDSAEASYRAVLIASMGLTIGSGKTTRRSALSEMLRTHSMLLARTLRLLKREPAHVPANPPGDLNSYLPAGVDEVSL